MKPSGRFRIERDADFLPVVFDCRSDASAVRCRADVRSDAYREVVLCCDFSRRVLHFYCLPFGLVGGAPDDCSADAVSQFLCLPPLRVLADEFSVQVNFEHFHSPNLGKT